MENPGRVPRHFFKFKKSVSTNNKVRQPAGTWVGGRRVAAESAAGGFRWRATAGSCGGVPVNCEEEFVAFCQGQEHRHESTGRDTNFRKHSRRYQAAGMREPRTNADDHLIKDKLNFE